TLGAEYLARILSAEGIESEIVEFAPGRGSLIARLPASGEGKQKPLCLLSHVDVVPAEADRWPKDTQPFSGAIDKEGTIWGRGALDMKGMGILELMTMIWIHRLKVPLDRELILLAVADEEVDSRGVKEMIKIWDRIGCSEVVNEGGMGIRNLLFEGQTV